MKIYRLGTLIALMFTTYMNAQASETVPQMEFASWPRHIFWTIIIFSTFYFLLKTYALPQVSRIISNRENIIADQLADAKHLFKQAENAKDSTGVEIHKAQAQANDIRDQVKQSIQQKSRDALQSLNTELDQKLEAAEKQINQHSAEAHTHLETVAAQTAADIVDAITGRTFTAQEILQLSARKDG